MKVTFLIAAIVLSLSANAQNNSAKMQDSLKMEQKDDKIMKNDKMMKSSKKSKMRKVKAKMKRDESMMPKSKM